MLILQILLNSLVTGTQVLLLAVPLYLVFLVSKLYHLALGAIGVAAAYGLYFFLHIGAPLWIAISGSVIIAIFLSLISYNLLESSARKRENMFGLLLSLSLGVVIESLLAIFFNTDAKSIIQEVLPTFNFNGLYLTVPGALTISVGLILTLIFFVLVKKTPWGRSTRSVAENSAIASTLRINPSTIRLHIFILAGLLAGFVAVMTVLNTALTPQTGFPLVILAFVALLVGGVSDMKGLIVATYIITLIPEIIISLSSGTINISSNWKMVIVFVIATVLLLWRPEGLFMNKVRSQ